jgi:hypothetical protein
MERRRGEKERAPMRCGNGWYSKALALELSWPHLSPHL